MKVTQVSDQTAQALQPIFRISGVGFSGATVAALVSAEASPESPASDVAALALPLTRDDLEHSVVSEGLLRPLFGSSSVTTKRLKGASLVAEGLKVFDPSISPIVDSLTVIVATKEVMDALADEDSTNWTRILKTGKLVVATGNLASNFGDAIPGVSQAAPFLKALGAVIKMGDGATLLVQSEDHHHGTTGLAGINAFTTKSADSR